MKKIFTLLCGLLLMTSATMHADQFTLNGIKYDTSPSYAGLTYHYLVKVVGVTTSGATLTVGGNTTVSYNNRNYTVYEVDRYALRNNSNLKTLKVVGSFDFEPGTFLGCNNLQTVDMSAVNDELYFEIADSLFYGCSQITSLKMPAVCYSIEKYAFGGCSSLSSLTVNYAHFIEPTAFTGCSHVTTITWNNPETMGDPSGSATSIYGAATTQAPFYAIRTQIKTAYINTNASAMVCSNMTNLEKAYIDSNVKSINVKAFYNCPKLSKVYLNNNSSSVLIGLKHIGNFGDNCFYNCTSLTGDLVVEGGDYLSFNENAFYNAGITSLTINNSPYTYIDKNAFQNCTALKSITLNTGINEIKQSAFSGCTAVTKLTWTSSDSFTNKTTFSWGNGGPVTKLTNLEELVINRKGRIDKFEFDGLQKLKKLTIGSNVTWVDDYAFINCTNIQNVSWSPSAMQSYTSQDVTPFYSSQGKITTFAFGSNITDIPPYLLCGQTQLSVVTIPSGVISIGHHAFFNVPLTSLTLPGSLKSIGSGAFYGNKLSNVTIPLSLEHIGEQAFVSSKPLTVLWNAQNCKFDYNNQSDGWGVFYVGSGDKSISAINFGDKVQSLPARLCYQAKNLTQIQLPASLQAIGDSAFFSCSNLIYIDCQAVTPPTIASEKVFRGCNSSDPKGLKGITLVVPDQSLSLYKKAQYWKDFFETNEDIEEVMSNETLEGTRKVLMDGKVYIRRNDRLYDLNGKQVR